MSGDIVSESISIDAPPDTVFAILADPRQHQRIDGSGSVQACTTGPARLSLDAQFGMGMKLFGLPYKIRNRVVEFDDGRQIAWRHVGLHRWRYQLEPTAEGGTTVTETWDASHYPGPTGYALRLPSFPARNREGIEKTLVKLKAAAEHDASSPR